MSSIFQFKSALIDHLYAGPGYSYLISSTQWTDVDTSKLSMYQTIYMLASVFAGELLVENGAEMLHRFTSLVNEVPLSASGGGGGGGPTSTDGLPEGSINKYYTDSRVRATVLTGLNLLESADITASDTVLTALGKLQNKITIVSNNTVVVEDSLSSDSTSHAVSVHQAKLLNDALGLKLDASAYNNYYKGSYSSLGALQSAHPTSTSGCYALVDAGSGQDAQVYVWDAQDGWVLSSSSGSLANTDALAEGSTNLYFTETRVRDTDLAGLSLSVGTDITASDTVLTALGKLQKQSNDLSSSSISSTDDLSEGSTNLYFTETRVRDTDLAGLSLSVGTDITASDTVLTALGKLQKQVTSVTNVRYSIVTTNANYTILSSDVTAVGRVIVCSVSSSGIVFTLPTPSSLGALVGDSVNVRQSGVGLITFVAGSGAVIEGISSTTYLYETKTLIVKTNTTWIIVGG